jgi:predicted anti-sigma-YlaC factor YlaD
LVPTDEMRLGRNKRRAVRDYRTVECEVAREALSARMDGEREPVPAARVDEHLAGCADCRGWYDEVAAQAAGLRRLAARPAPVPDHRRAHRFATLRATWPRWALGAIGGMQLVVAAAQAFGLGVGLSSHHGMAADGHLLNESTAWSAALGLVMIGAAARPAGAAGLAGVLTAFAAVLTGYVISDAFSGAVTAERILTHVPVAAGAILAVLVWRGHRGRDPGPGEAVQDVEITLPHNASRGRRRGHLWSADGAA